MFERLTSFSRAKLPMSSKSINLRRGSSPLQPLQALGGPLDAGAAADSPGALSACDILH